jgi:hypothetical protein
MAAHHAAQMMRQSHNVVQQNMQRRRSAVFQILVPPTAPIETTTTSIGLELAKSFEIKEYEPIDGATPFEVRIDGEQVWLGMGDDRAHGLLLALMAIADKESDD